MASGSGDGRKPELPRGLIDRRGAPAGKAARLPSLRGPRDLTLGGVPKRVFAPNIPVRKERTTKEETKDQPSTKQDDKKQRDKSGRGRGRGRGRERNEDNFIQIHSLFEQGPAAQQRKSWGNSGEGGDGGGSRSKASAAPRIKTENSQMSADKLSHTLDRLMKDDFIADGPEEDPYMVPVTLPMSASGARFITEKKKKVAERMDIKEEPGVAGPSAANAKVTNLPFVGLSGPTDDPDQECADLLQNASKSKSGKEEFLLVQLPNVLPGVPATEPEAVASTAASKDDKDAEEKKDKTPKSALRDFSEGYLGKMRVRKSGKVELVLGDIVLDVTMGVPASFLQDVVSVRTDEDDKKMTVLGHVKQKMVITPDFEGLLNAKAAEKT